MGGDHPPSMQAFRLLNCFQNRHHRVYDHLCMRVTSRVLRWGRGCRCSGEALCLWGGTCGEVVVSACSVRRRDRLGLVSYTEGVENNVDKANLEQRNLKFKYRDAHEAHLSFPPPNRCGSLSRQFACGLPAPSSGPLPCVVSRRMVLPGLCHRADYHDSSLGHCR